MPFTAREASRSLLAPTLPTPPPDFELERELNSPAFVASFGFGFSLNDFELSGVGGRPLTCRNQHVSPRAHPAVVLKKEQMSGWRGPERLRLASGLGLDHVDGSGGGRELPSGLNAMRK